MTKTYALTALIISLLFTTTLSQASNDKELRKQRQAAHKERQLQKKERTRENREAVKAFKDFAKSKTAEYKDKLSELTTEFQLKEVDLKATHEAKVASAEAEYQKKLMGLFTTQGKQLTEDTIKEFQHEAKAYHDELFALKKKAADNVHNAWNTNEKRKHALLDERDNLILKEADSLGLTKDFAPIIATKVGDELTSSEKKWNQSEKKAVEKLKAQNQKLLAKYRNAAKLRAFELSNKNEDFKLLWDKKAELQSIDSSAGFYNLLLMQPGKKEFDQQAFMNELAENNKKKEMINIKYKKIASQNRILRKQEKKAIMSGQ